MKLIDELSLKFKLYTLLALFVFGLSLIGGIGYLNMYKMKKNLDALYFGSYIPVTELNKIQNIYNKDINHVFHQLKSSEVLPSEAAEKIELSRKNILTIWDSYTAHFKRENELEYIKYAHEELIHSSNYLQRLSLAIAELDIQSLHQISSAILQKNIAHMDDVINKIISYEKEIAHYERKNFLNTYDSIIYKLAVILIIVIAAAIIIIAPIFQSIENHTYSLIHTSKKLQVANKKLETASITDPLTELFNRRYFNLVYNRELTRCIRENKSMAFMMLDIDYFKGYNDYYGHIKGDTTLKMVAKSMKNTLKRPGDYLFRLGGEEFGILICDITQENAYHMAEKLRQNIYALNIEHKRSKVCEFLTASIGVVVLKPDKEIDTESIISRADDNLYRAKEEGRNKVIQCCLQNCEEATHSA